MDFPITKVENVEGALPLSGGTMSGSLCFGYGNVICGDGKESYTQMRGGTESVDGARLTLYGSEYGSGAYSGAFQLTSSNNNSGNIHLLGYPDGRLTWNAKNIALQGALSMPYTGATGTTISIAAITGDGYKAPHDGWVAVAALTKSQATTMNWVRVFNNARQALSLGGDAQADHYWRGLFPVAKNGVVRVTHGSNITIETAYFYPAQSEV